MTAVVLVLAAFAVAGWLVVWWRARWRAAQRVLAAVELEAARHVGRLVPGQRQPVDPVWWEFVYSGDGP